MQVTPFRRANHVGALGWKGGFFMQLQILLSILDLVVIQ